MEMIIMWFQLPDFKVTTCDNLLDFLVSLTCTICVFIWRGVEDFKVVIVPWSDCVLYLQGCMDVHFFSQQFVNSGILSKTNYNLNALFKWGKWSTPTSNLWTCGRKITLTINQTDLILFHAVINPADICMLENPLLQYSFMACLKFLL